MNLTEAERRFLQEPRFAVVATIAPDGMPHQTVMWYALETDGLLLNTPLDSLKHQHLKRDPRLSICVEDGYRYMTLRGTVTLDESPEGAQRDYQRLGQRYRDTLVTRPAVGSGDDSERIRELLSRPRITLHLSVETVISNGIL